MVELICPQCTSGFQAAPGAVVSCPACKYRGGRVPGGYQREMQVAEGEFSHRVATPGAQKPLEEETNRSAITSLVLGLCFFVPPAGLFALMFGVIALGQIKESKVREDRPNQRGRGLAISGIITGAVFQLLWFVLIIGLMAFGAKSLDSILGR